MTFADLSLLPALQQAVADEGYTTPTPIQAQAIPEVLAGHDLIGLAQTGTGKTAAFTLPILQRLQANPPRHTPRGIRCLILTPTRELAIQIQESFANYGRHLKLRSTVIFGGVGQNPQVQAVRSHPEILIATPGRLLDLMQQGLLSLSTVEIFVLDEADRMLDMGFIHDIRKIIPKVPADRQTLLFSATMPNEIQGLAQSILRNPKQVAVAPPAATADLVEQRVFMVGKEHKKELLRHLLDTRPEIKRVLVFGRTKHGSNKIEKDLNAMGINTMAIHGNKSQTARQQALADFKAGKLRVLVATDIASRGIDIEELSHVINYELPNIPETYVHRIGRTGRAGFSGEAYSFCDHEERDYLLDIQKLIRQEVPVDTEHPFIGDNVPEVKFGSRPSGLRPPLRSPEHMGGGNRGGGRGQQGGGGNRGGGGGGQRPDSQRASNPGRPQGERGQHQRGAHEAPRPPREAREPRDGARPVRESMRNTPPPAPPREQTGESGRTYSGTNPAYLPREGQQPRRKPEGGGGGGQGGGGSRGGGSGGYRGGR